MTKVLIEMEKGQISRVISSTPIQYVVINDDLGGNGIEGINGPDKIADNLWELYGESDPVETEIRDELKRLKF